MTLGDLSLGLKPELQVAVCWPSILFPKFVGARSNLFPGPPGGQTLSKPLPEFLGPRPKPLIGRLVRDARRDAAGLRDLAL